MLYLFMLFTHLFFYTKIGNPHAHGPLPDLAKNLMGPSHPRLHSLNHTPHACHKQANVEHIKRVSCNDC